MFEPTPAERVTKMHEQPGNSDLFMAEKERLFPFAYLRIGAAASRLKEKKRLAARLLEEGPGSQIAV